METTVKVEDFLRMEVSTTRIYIWTLSVVTRISFQNFMFRCFYACQYIVRSLKLYYRIDTSWICLSGVARPCLDLVP